MRARGSLLIAMAALACVHTPTAPARPSPPHTASSPEPELRCPVVEAPPLSGEPRAEQVHVQSPATLRCPAVVDPRGELFAVCAGDGVAILELARGRELAFVADVRSGAWGWDASGRLLVARDEDPFVEIVSLDPRDPELEPRAIGTVKVNKQRRQTVGLSRYGEVAIWLRRPPELFDAEPNDVRWWRLAAPEVVVERRPLDAAAEFLWASDGSSYAYRIDGETRVLDSETHATLASFARGVLDAAPWEPEVPLDGGGRGGVEGLSHARRGVVGLGRTRLIFHNEVGRLYVATRGREPGQRFGPPRPLDEIPRHAFFEGLSPAEDVAAFRVAPELVPTVEQPYGRAPDGPDELLLVDLDRDELVATQTFADGFGAATIVDPRCGVVLIDDEGPRWWPTQVADAPARRLGLLRSSSAGAEALSVQMRDSVQLDVDLSACTATLEREGQEPEALAFPPAPGGKPATHCVGVLVNPERTRALLLTREAPADNELTVFPEPPEGWTWRRIRGRMVALDRPKPKSLWTRDLPVELTAANFVGDELLVASGSWHSTLIRLSVASGRALGRRAMPKHAAIVSLAPVAGGFVVVTNDDATRWHETQTSRSAGVLSFLLPDGPIEISLRMFDEDWTERWSERIQLSPPFLIGWFPILDRTGATLVVDAEGRHLLANIDGSRLAAVEAAGLRWIEAPPGVRSWVAFTQDRRQLWTWTGAGSFELRAVSAGLERIWTHAAYGDGQWIRTHGDGTIEHSPGDAWALGITER